MNTLTKVFDKLSKDVPPLWLGSIQAVCSDTGIHKHLARLTVAITKKEAISNITDMLGYRVVGMDVDIIPREGILIYLSGEY